MDNFIITKEVLKSSSKDDLLNIAKNLKNIVKEVESELGGRVQEESTKEEILLETIATRAIRRGFNSRLFYFEIDEEMTIEITGNFRMAVSARDMHPEFDDKDMICEVDFSPNADDIMSDLLSDYGPDKVRAALRIPEYKRKFVDIRNNIENLKIFIKENYEIKDLDDMVMDVISKICEIEEEDE